MGSKEFIEKCKEIVREYANEHLDKSDIMPNFDVFVVMYQNRRLIINYTR